MKNAPPPIFFLVVFPLYFATVWIGITWIISRLGWNVLATAFPAATKPSGQQFGLVSASINGLNYNNCLTAVVTPSGLWLQPWRPFQLFHAPILIPWSACSPFEEGKIFWMRRLGTSVQIPGGRRIKLVLMPTELAEEARKQVASAK